MRPTGVEPTVQTHRAHCLGKVWKGGFGAIVATLSAMAGAFLAGCGAGAAVGSLQMRSLGQDPVVLTGSYVTAFYSDRGPAQISFLLADVGLQELLSGNVKRATVIHLDLLWVPAGGVTPMDASATNATIRYVVIADGEVGVYGGAGFALPRGAQGDHVFGLLLEDASLSLLESTEGFIDLLSPARLTGRATAALDNQRMQQMYDGVSRIVSDALGRTRFVFGESFELAASRAYVSRRQRDSGFGVRDDLLNPEP